jgi:lysophospholipase L1-like esterase
MRILLFLLTCVSLLSAAPLKTAQLLAAGKEPVRIVCIGDSITGVYYHTGGLRAYPEMLQIALQKIHPQAQVTVRNAGISGDTTTGGLKRLERDVLAHKPHLVTIMFGMNDLVRTSMADFQNNLREIIRRCRAIDAEVVLCTQNSIVESPQRPGAKLAEFTQAIRDIAKAESLPVADCFAAFEAVHAKDALEWNLLLSDPIHPNMAGHKLFAETIAQTITGQKASLSRHRPTIARSASHARSAQSWQACQSARDAALRHAHRSRDSAALSQSRRQRHPWPVEGQTLAQLEESAKKVRTLAQDLVLIAVPGSLPVQKPEAFHKSYSWIMNWSLSFGPQQWDVIVALPSATKTKLTTEEQQHEALARRLIEAQDLHLLADADAALPPCIWIP